MRYLSNYARGVDYCHFSILLSIDKRNYQNVRLLLGLLFNLT